MERLYVPFACHNNGIDGPVSIFISSDYNHNKEKCLILIQGTGQIQAGYFFMQ